MIGALVLLATFLVLGLPAAAVGIPWCLLTGDVAPMYRWALAIVRVGLRLAGVRVVVEGVEHVPRDRACVFMANHVSNLDPPVLIPHLPGRTSVFFKRSLMKIPVLGYAMRLAQFVPVDRSGNARDAQASVEVAKRVLAAGVHITSFVEGTRSRDGRLLPFKKGPFFLAMESGAPCVPVSIYGTETLMGKGSLRVRRGVAHVRIHAPVVPGEVADRDELMARVRAAVASGLPEWMQPTD